MSEIRHPAKTIQMRIEDLKRRIDGAQRSLGLGAGEFLEDLQSKARESLERLRTEMTLYDGDSLLAIGRLQGRILELERLISAKPLLESMIRDLQAEIGKQEQALQDVQRR